MKRRPLIALALTVGTLSTACRKRPTDKARFLPPGAVVLALGDSITHGTGAAAEAAYPTELARLSG